MSAQGEIRHEQCRFGVFAEEAYRLNARTNTETPFAMPLCAWKPPVDAPPLLHRLWSGAIEFERDCAVCPCFAPVEVNPPAQDNLLEELGAGIIYKTNADGEESDEVDIFATEKLFARAFVALLKQTKPPP